ncbi:hypothetical protein C3432_15935 [Citrobacter amalonaticus]|nr:hypothetical protein C3432_15935 [Citrobacter amalonaticus]POT71883.1 hypothetical protein C3436_21930 [Citrobacter amalonaticus]
MLSAGDSGNIKTDAQASKMVRKHNVSRAILMLRNARVLRAIRWQRDKHQKRYSAGIDEVIHQIAQ